MGWTKDPVSSQRNAVERRVTLVPAENVSRVQRGICLAGVFGIWQGTLGWGQDQGAGLNAFYVAWLRLRPRSSRGEGLINMPWQDSG